jgi:hypothetical protein
MMEDVLERIKLIQYGTPNHPLVGSGETVPTSTGPIATGWVDGDAQEPREYAPGTAVTDGEVVDQWAAAARDEKLGRQA